MGSKLSGNPNAIPPTNPNGGEDGRATRFGQPGGANPSEAGKLNGSARRALRVFGAQEIDADPEKAQEEVKRILRSEKNRPGRTTLSAMAAARLFMKSIAKPDAATFNALVDNMEGKLWQPNLNADLSRIQSMSDEEIDAELERLRKAEGANPIDGEAAPEGSDEAVAGEAQQVPDSDITPGI